ncbi:MAG: TonB-dependent receptor [Gammaproteobacteria bacterium]|nr:MAG: TonB-dependent receptor [Gammaproteobacteria bacterium]
MKEAFRKLQLLALCLLLSHWALAQFTVSGKVTDTNGEPLIGATVLLKGTTIGTVTDLDGMFTLDVPQDRGTVVISYTGYETKEIEVSPQNRELNVVLEFASEALSEVVVVDVGYGTARKEALTGAVAQVRPEKLEQVPLSSFEQALQGNVAGLQAAMGNGQPGANVSVRIRGQGSISASSEPLYVIDGVPVISGNLTVDAETSNPLASLNPNDIESVSVLKDAAATAIYGSRGANGVILITTKSGKSGRPKIDVRTMYGFNDWAIPKSKRLRGLTALEYADLYIEGYVNRGRTVEEAIQLFNKDFPDPITGLPAVDIMPDGQGGWTLGEVRVDTRWVDEISRIGATQSVDLSVSGGNDLMRYYASGSYFYQQAPIIYSDMDRYSSRLNVDVTPSDKVTITNHFNLSRTQQHGMNDATRWANPMYNSYLLPPTVPIYDAEGNFYAGHRTIMGANNPVGSLSGDDEQTWDQVRVMDNLSASYELLDNLVFKSAWSFDIINYHEFYYRNPRYGDGRNVGGLASETERDILTWIGTQTLTYENTFGDKHNYDLLAGYEATKTSMRTVYAFAQNFPSPQLRLLASASSPQETFSSLSEYAFESMFFRANYNYDYKYYLSASVRRDGSSRFGINNRYGTFWSVGFSWRLDQEDFLAGNDLINALKLRASYGVSGNAGIGNYVHLRTISYSGIDYLGQPGGAPTQIGNSDLTWEKSKSYNIGLDFTILNSLSGTVEYFNRLSDDLLLNVPVSRTTGFRSITKNFGAMRNKGVELTLDYSIVDRPDLRWSVGGNITFLKNRITRLDKPFTADTHDSKRREEGRDYESYYLFDWAGVDPETGAPLWYTDSTRTETTSNIAEAQRFFTGQTATPSFFGGFNTSFSWKGLSIDAQFTTSWDNWIYDATAWVIQGDGRFTPRSQTNLVLKRWRKPGDVTDVPKFAWGNTSGSNQRGSTRWLHDGTHIRLRNLTVAWRLPDTLLDQIGGFRSARIYLRGINLWTWTREKDLYLDPETNFSGIVNSPVPNMKTISFGLDLGF